jgi:galactan 5-O-arabinofuranosyltransferase
MSGAWLARFWLAHTMEETKLVQLYPRTTMLILYCLLILAGIAAFSLLARHRRSDPTHPVHGRSGMIGAFCALALVLGSAGSAIADRYMPIDTWPFSLGRLAWASHHADQFRWGQRWDKPKPPKASPGAGTVH